MNYKKYFLIYNLICLSLLSIPANLFASGGITGVIMDKQTKEYLPGANVIIKGTVIGAAADFHGSFFIQNLKAGKYTLVISYLGYKKKEISVNVLEEKKTSIKIFLELKNIVSDEVIVSSQAIGQVKAINQQISSESIKNIVSEARIKELPDANAAEALGRLPGVTINRSGGEASSVNVRGQSGGRNTFYVEGMRMLGPEGRGVGLANIATSMISGIEVQKSFMPDNDGDVSGGGITFKLKEAEKGFKTDISIKQGYNGLTESFKMRDLSWTFSDRFIDNKLGVLANLVYDQKDRSLDQLNSGFGNKSLPNGANDLVGVKLLNGSFSRRIENRNRLGLTYNIDFKVPDHKIIFNGFFANLKQNVDQTNNAVFRTPKRVIYSANKFVGNENSFLMGLKGEHNISIFQINWNSYYSSASKSVPEIYGIEAENNSFDMNWNDSIKISELYRQIGNQHDILNTKVNATTYGNQDKKATEVAFKIDIKLPFNLSNTIAGHLKFGGKYREATRKFNELGREVWYSTPGVYRVDGAKLLTELYPEFNLIISPRYNILSYLTFAKDEKIPFKAGDNLELYFPPDWNKLEEAIQRARTKYRKDLEKQSYNYNNIEIYRAAYIMANIKIGSMITFIPGVRFESVVSSTNAFKYVADPSKIGWEVPGSVIPVSGSNKNDFLLPMFTLRFKPLTWLDIRTSVTKTLIRPSFEQMSPRFNETTEYDRNYGNPDILPAVSQNYDLYMSIYENHLGLFTVGGFYKDIKNEINQIDERIVDNEIMGLPDKYRNRTFSTYKNNSFYSFIKGIEIDWQTRFWYLPRFLDGIVFNINYTLLKTESKRQVYFQTVKELPIPPYRIYTYVDSFLVSDVLNSPDQTLKFSLGYEKGGFSGRVSLFFQARAQSYLHPLFKNLNEATDKLYRWDIQLSQKIIKGLTFYLNMNNITDWPDQNSMMFWSNAITDIENYGWSMDLGIRYRY